MVPGGLVTYIVRKKVPGDSFDLIKFWLGPFSEREVIRNKFRQVFAYDYEAFLWSLPANIKQEFFAIQVYATHGYSI